MKKYLNLYIMPANKPTLITFGCRLNTYETQWIQQNNPDAPHNAIIVNTCAVTAEAVRQARQSIRKMHKEHPQSPIFVTGCGAQMDPTQFQSLEGVIKVVGNAGKLTKNAFVQDNTNHNTFQLGNIQLPEDPLYHFENRTRAFVQIQTGCNHHCTFCIIPQLRGISKSQSIETIHNQIVSFLQSGYQEIVLTGVDIASYNDGKHTLGGLLLSILNTHPTLKRLRLSSLDCIPQDKLFLQAIASPVILPYFHFSVQSGDPLILKRMSRRHTPSELAQLIKIITAIRPESVFGGDIIVGFPTEQEIHHQNTLSFLQNNHFTKLHVFPYSKRPSTPAVRIPNQIPKIIKKQRAKDVRQLGNTLYLNTLKNHIGKTVSVLFEKNKMGYSETYLPVFSSKPVESGTIQSIYITHIENNTLIGKHVS